MDLETKLGMFHFLRPAWLGTLLALPVIAGLLTRAAARPSALRRICDAELLEHLCEDDTPGRRRLPIAAFSAAWIATALALAGPTWQRLPQPGFEQPERVVFALDLSASMAAALKEMEGMSVYVDGVKDLTIAEILEREPELRAEIEEELKNDVWAP